MNAESPSPLHDSASPAGPRGGHVGRPHDRWVAPGGWRRAVLGTTAGLVAGFTLAVAVRRDRCAPSTEAVGQ